MNLYSITIMFRNSPNLVRLMFKNEATATAAFDKFSHSAVVGAYVATDDYGKTAVVRYDEYAGVTFAYTNNELSAAQDEQILQAHAQIQLNKKVSADSILQAENKRQSIIQPVSGANGAMRQ